LPTEERINRVKQLLEILKVLSRDIKGRRENLAPLFAIGGVYPVSNPFFMGRLQLMGHSGRWQLQLAPLQDALSTTWGGTSIQTLSHIGLVSGWLANEAELRDRFSGTGNIEHFFKAISQDVETAFGV